MLLLTLSPTITINPAFATLLHASVIAGAAQALNAHDPNEVLGNRRPQLIVHKAQQGIQVTEISEDGLNATKLFVETRRVVAFVRFPESRSKSSKLECKVEDVVHV